MFKKIFFAAIIALSAFTSCKKDPVNVSLDGAYRGTYSFGGVTTTNAIVTVGNSSLSVPNGTFRLINYVLGANQSTATIQYANLSSTVGILVVSSSNTCSFTGSSNGIAISFTGTRQ